MSAAWVMCLQVARGGWRAAALMASGLRWRAASDIAQRRS